MQDLSLQLEKRTPKNYQIPPKNYPRIVFPPKFCRFIPYLIIRNAVNLHHRKIQTNIHFLKATYMKSLSFRKDLVGVQDELLRFAYKLTTDREEANDLLQETSLKALDNEDTGSHR